ncbi:hypothetical protein OCU04_012749 [Sclerotinia nivalis]|uniref:Uncharacterized protein n=1 Tax=Sclerotinia nivalis TaxID=352851 RepID=A0A9X0A9D3_9HELO|nr:hypothetical protein OCU04_012749 [Sclerotinia nivalis]
MLGKRNWFAMQTVIDEIIHDENGNPNNSAEAGLHLELQNFGPEPMVQPGGSLCHSIYIPVATLCSYIELAENRTTMIKQRKGIFDSIEPRVRKRPRESTPPEELDQRRERRFRESEERVVKQAEGRSII